MSYCRWSSDDWKSDVYVYEDVSGDWTTHVAGRRHVLPDLPPRVDLPHPFTEAQFEAWWERQELVSELVSAAELVDIGLLVQLRDAGYHVQQVEHLPFGTPVCGGRACEERRRVRREPGV